MRGVLPKPSFEGFFDYMLFAAGLSIGVAVFKPLADGIEGAISRPAGKNGGA